MAHLNENEDDEKPSKLTLFGGDKGWHASDFTSSDDRVRGGKSHSYLDIKDGTARFYGNLDIKTLGGAGFASQRTTGDDREWDLSDYGGVQLAITKGDKKRYTFIIKDELLEPDSSNGREKATISWECDFELPPQDEPDETHNKSVYIPFDSLNPTYRGKLQDDADPLDLKSIKRLSIMMRSFFGTQEGDFSLTIESISALDKAPAATASFPAKHADPGSVDMRKLEAGMGSPGEDSRLEYSSTESGDMRWQRTTAFALTGLAIVFVTYQIIRRLSW